MAAVIQPRVSTAVAAAGCYCIPGARPAVGTVFRGTGAKPVFAATGVSLVSGQVSRTGAEREGVPRRRTGRRPGQPWTWGGGGGTVTATTRFVTTTTLTRPQQREKDVTTAGSRTTATFGMSGLMLRKPCGDSSCDAYHMCSAHDMRCYPCHDYCDDASNNFDARICEQQCQDYIHDYMKHYVTDKNIQDALNALENLKSLVIFMTILVAIALVFISATLLFIWKRERRIRKIKNGGQDSFFKKKLASLQYLKKKDQQQTVTTVSETVANQQTAATAACTSLAATQTELTTVVSPGGCAAGAGTSASSSSSASSSASSSGQRTNTSSAGGSSRGGGSSSNSNKLPCEDVALEFSGYDNFALKVSPVLPGKTTATAPQPPHQLQFTP